MRARAFAYVLPLALLTLGLLAARAEAGSLEGTVRNPASGRPVAGATAVLSGERIDEVVTERTGKDGRFVFEELPDGTYHLLVIFGDARVFRDATVAGGATSVNVRLDASAGETIVVHEQPPTQEPTPPEPAHDYAGKHLPYSDEAMDRDIWAVAWVLLNLDETGKVVAMRFVKRPGTDLDDIAVREAFKYRFKPARDEYGRAIPSTIIWKMEWPSFWWMKELRPQWRMDDGKQPPCSGSGPLNLGSWHPTYRDCSVPDLASAAKEPLITAPSR